MDTSLKSMEPRKRFGKIVKEAEEGWTKAKPRGHSGSIPPIMAIPFYIR